MKQLVKSLLPDALVARLHNAARARSWKASGYAMPCPHHIKQATLLRNGLLRSTWVETGTYMGDTTALLA